MYSDLIAYGVKYLLAVGIVIFAGLSPESFNFNNPVGTNVGYYLVGNSPLWLVTMASFIDIFGIWSLAVCAIGCGVVARIKTSSAAAVAVLGWLIVFMLGITGLVAAFA